MGEMRRGGGEEKQSLREGEDTKTNMSIGN